MQHEWLSSGSKVMPGFFGCGEFSSKVLTFYSRYQGGSFTHPAADTGIKKRLQLVASDIKNYSWLILSA